MNDEGMKLNANFESLRASLNQLIKKFNENQPAGERVSEITSLPHFESDDEVGSVYESTENKYSSVVASNEVVRSILQRTDILLNNQNTLYLNYQALIQKLKDEGVDLTDLDEVKAINSILL